MGRSSAHRLVDVTANTSLLNWSAVGMSC